MSASRAVSPVRTSSSCTVLCVDHRLLLDLDDILAAADGWERIYLDLPGFGLTSPLDSPGGLPEIVDWLDQAVAELIGSGPYHPEVIQQR